MALVLVFSCVVLGLHTYITTRFPANIPPPEAELLASGSFSAAAQTEEQQMSEAIAPKEHLNGSSVSVEADCTGRIRGSSEASTSSATSQGEQWGLLARRSGRE